MAYQKKESKPVPEFKPDARRLALYALSDVVRGGGYSTLALGKQLKASNLPDAEKRLATNIFYTTIENLYRIDFVLSRLVDTKPEPIVEDILRLGVAQLLFMDRIPDHAAVDEAVKQTKRFHREHAAGFVNGTLHSVIRRRDDNGISYPKKEDDPVAYLSVMYSVSRDAAEALLADFGEEETERMLAYKPAQRFQTVRPNMLRMTNEQFLAYADEKKWTYVKSPVPGALRLMNTGDLAGDPDYKDGLFSLQGESAMLAAMAVEAKAGQKILDTCAAPGGKTAFICEQMGVTGRVFAWDEHEHRVELLQAVRKRLKLDNMRCLVRDASVIHPEICEEYDTVLIDAPCTGLGVMLDKPDIKLHFAKESFADIVKVQEKILNACSEYPVYGGHLVYSTCTVLKEENERQIEKFLATHPEYEFDPDDSFLPESFKPLWRNGFMQLRPENDGVEGFYIARLKRVRR